MAIIYRDVKMSKKYALLIGINKYLFMQAKYQLHGCVNDAKLIKNILINKFNFESKNITSLYDEAATRDNILAAMERLANIIAKDDILVFHYSGHGHQCKIKTEFTDEGSGKDNCILPCDDSEHSPAGDIWREIRDHQINEWLQRIAQKTPYTTLIFDACHSATMTRSTDKITTRSLPTEDRPLARSAPDLRTNTSQNTSASLLKRPSAGGWLTLSDNYVVMSGCRDTQKSKEKYFSQDGQNTKHGVLTYHLSRALLRAKPGTTYRDAFELACTSVVADVSEQNPQIEGALDRELFGVKDIEPLAFIPITHLDGQQIILGGGAAHGLRKGSVWTIYPPGSKQADSNQALGSLEVTAVGTLSSTALLLDNTGQVLLNSRCVEVKASYAPDLLQVDISELSEAYKMKIVAGIRQSKLVAVAGTPDDAHIRANIITSDSVLPPTITAQQQQLITQDSWAFFEADEVLAMPLHAVTEPGVVRVLLDNLEKIAKFRNVLLLDNPTTTLNVEFNLFKQSADGKLVLANGGSTEFLETEPMVLELKNNETVKAVFFSILWISADREISHFYPYRKASEELSPGKTIRIGLGNNKLTASLSKQYYADIGSESCKVIFSSTQADFSWLNQQGLRSSNGSQSNIPAFDSAFIGKDLGTRSADTQNPNSSAELEEQYDYEDWDAVTRSFILRRTSNS